MFLQYRNCNSTDHKVSALYELPLFLVDESGDGVLSLPAFQSRSLSTPKLPASLIRILGEDG